MGRVFDVLIIGGGVIGTGIGSEILRRFPGKRVAILEKEAALGLHASGRNSGVIHSGFYYSPDSLKAQLTRDGNTTLRKFASTHDIKIRNTGKVVVAQRPEDIVALEQLYRRGLANGVDVELVSEKELRGIEPMAKTMQTALWSPNTAVGDPSAFMGAFSKEFVALGGEIIFGAKVQSVKRNLISTQKGDFEGGHVVNAAGLYADKVAKLFNFGSRYTMIPFLGIYVYAPKLKGSLSRQIYPTPDPRNPFLGVHLTTTVDGSVKVGPTAIPVLSREQYSLASGFKFSEFLEILSSYPKFALSPHHDAVSLIKTELPKLSKRVLISQARLLAPSIKLSDFTELGRPGIRAQLFDLQEKKLEMDFVVEGDGSSTHVLNAVSPAWTSCISFSRHVVDVMHAKGAF